MRKAFRGQIFIVLVLSLSPVASCTKDRDEPKGIVKDVDGNIYNIVNIGAQTWLAENLKVTKYNDGTKIPNVTDSITWRALSTGAYCDYDNNPQNSDIYGRLYNWYVASFTNLKNVCPEGWHVPSDAEWTILIDNNGGSHIAGGKLKETGITHWGNPWGGYNIGATNETGFTALPGGRRSGDGTYFLFELSGYWWASPDVGCCIAWATNIYCEYTIIEADYYQRTEGFSVRCLKD